MKKTIGIILICVATQSSAQIANLEMNWDGEISILLEKDFIASKQIAQVNCDYSTKVPNQIIKSSSEEKIIKYDRLGRQTEYSHKKEIGRNTIHTHSLTNYERNTIFSETEKDEVGYHCTYYTHRRDTSYLEIYRGEKYSPENKEISNDSTLINKRTFIKKPFETKILNKNGLHTRTKSTQIDSLGFISSESLRYELTNKTFTKSYSYNSEGLLSEIAINSATTPKSVRIFYDRNDLIERAECVSNNETKQVIEFVYKESGWLDAIIYQNPKNNHIKITKYHYVLYP